MSLGKHLGRFLYHLYWNAAVLVSGGNRARMTAYRLGRYAVLSTTKAPGVSAYTAAKPERNYLFRRKN